MNENRVVVLSIHQPRYSIFKLFDSLSLLSQGEMVYHGQAALALEYFDRLGTCITDKLVPCIWRVLSFQCVRVYCLS